MTTARADSFTPVWKALADPTRRRILDLLREKPRTTGELAARFHVSRYAVMKHLTVLERARLVVVRRRGRERWNHLNAIPLQRIHERWISPYQARWATALLDVRRLVEGGADIHSEGGRIMPGTATAAGVRTLHIEQEITIDASPAKVFAGLTKNVGYWWGGGYIAEGATDLIIETEVGGRFYQTNADGGGWLWGTVVGFEQDKSLDLSGSIGLEGPVAGHVSFELEPKGKGTLLKLSHTAFGMFAEDAEEKYGHGWSDLLGTHLRAFVEKGEKSGVRR